MDSQSCKTWQTVNSKLTRAAHFKFSGFFNRNVDKIVLGYFYLENKVVEHVLRRLYQQKHQVIKNFNFARRTEVN